MLLIPGIFRGKSPVLQYSDSCDSACGVQWLALGGDTLAFKPFYYSVRFASLRSIAAKSSLACAFMLFSN
jgi:hypothetical protein